MENIEKDYIKKLEEALAAALAIIDGPEINCAQSIAWAHGWECDKDVSAKNVKVIENAYALIGMARPRI